MRAMRAMHPLQRGLRMDTFQQHHRVRRESPTPSNFLFSANVLMLFQIPSLLVPFDLAF